MFWSVTKVAGEDLSAAPQFIAVNLTDGKAAASAAAAGGILQNKPKSGEHATLFYAGETEFRAGGTITAGVRLTVTASGYIIALPATGGFSVGKAIDACASGSIGRGLFDFMTPSYVVSGS